MDTAVCSNRERIDLMRKITKYKELCIICGHEHEYVHTVEHNEIFGESSHIRRKNEKCSCYEKIKKHAFEADGNNTRKMCANCIHYYGAHCEHLGMEIDPMQYCTNYNFDDHIVEVIKGE